MARTWWEIVEVDSSDTQALLPPVKHARMLTSEAARAIKSPSAGQTRAGKQSNSITSKKTGTSSPSASLSDHGKYNWSRGRWRAGEDQKAITELQWWSETNHEGYYLKVSLGGILLWITDSRFRLENQRDRSELPCLNEGWCWTGDLNAQRTTCWGGPRLVWLTGHRMVGQSSRS